MRMARKILSASEWRSLVTDEARVGMPGVCNAGRTRMNFVHERADISGTGRGGSAGRGPNHPAELSCDGCPECGSPIQIVPWSGRADLSVCLEGSGKEVCSANDATLDGAVPIGTASGDLVNLPRIRKSYGAV
jgi:hypothetical protein